MRRGTQAGVMTSPQAASAEVVPVVHFPHPGAEHVAPRIGRFPWSTLPVHRRKFMRASGSYLDAAGVDHQGDLTFWGEWESASEVVETWPNGGTLPTALHTPLVPRARRVQPGQQNTDPWVFGDSFRYTNCHQRGAMRTLPAGSLILFGSTLDHEFVLDTVFVVRDSTGPLPISRLKRHPYSDLALNACTYNSLSGTTALHCGPSDDSLTFVLYRGTTPHDNPSMFSFTPARPGRDLRFRRPILSLGPRPSGDPYVNAASWRVPKGSPRSKWVPRAEAQRVWEVVADQVLNDGQGLALAHHIDSPESK